MDRSALTPSAEHAAEAVRVAVGGELSTGVRPVAAMLAQAQDTAVLLSLLTDLSAGDPARTTELGACLLQEMVLRGKSPDPVTDAWAARLAGHPLAGLPTRLSPGEERLQVSRFRIGGRTGSMPFGPGRAEPCTFPGAVVTATGRTTPADATAAVTTWLTKSNGLAEAAEYSLARPLDPAEVGYRTLYALKLACLAGGGLAMERAELGDVVAMLFAAAENGGAYDQGMYGAYGRAAAWRSVRALTGGAHEGCTWWIFEAANDWFYGVAWDLGVVCLRPGGHVLAVLAATDTD